MVGEDSVRLRIAREEDAPQILALINSAFRRVEGSFVVGDRISLGEVLSCLANGKFLLAENEKFILGCVYVEPRNSAERQHAYLGLLAVDPERQQSGLGTLLMTRAENYCRDLGCRSMEIKIVNLRKDLPEFYQKRGYVETDTSPFPSDVETILPCHFIDMSKPL